MIHVIDSIIGSGKTTYIIDTIQNLVDEDNKIIYVTPFLTEVERVIQNCTWGEFHQPNEVDFGSKTKSLLHLIRNRHNIATTHSLFSLLNQEVQQSVRECGYVLVLDEVMECVTFFDQVTECDFQMLKDGGYVTQDDDTNRLSWSFDHTSPYDGKFNSFKRLCDNRKLVLHGEKVILQEFPSEFLGAFVDVYVLTCLFEGSPMSAYLSKHGYRYNMLTLVDHELKPWADYCDESAIKSQYKDLVKIYDGSMNKVGHQSGKRHPLSVSWYNTQVRESTSALRTLQGSTQNYFKKVTDTPAKHNAWTTFCNYRSRLKGERYTKGFVAFNCRATNEHIEKRSMAYLCNVFPNPVISQYVNGQYIKVNSDLYALSEMLQWIWRSQIRRYDPIHLFIPSERMRSLLYLWLNTRSTPELIQKLS
ncbi:hypothetical protein OFEAOIEE_LOCUS3962 [Methylorubrum extorquens]